MTDHETERARLKRIYSEKSDAGLGELALDAGSLTEVAREVLRAEMETRGMQSELVLLAHTRETKAATKKISGPLVMVKRYRDMPEAQVAESVLDSAGIDCFLADENTIRMDWLWSNLLGGFKLMVRPEDHEEAIKLLEQPVNPEMRVDEREDSSANETGEAKE
jgi:hypothetical protein